MKPLPVLAAALLTLFIVWAVVWVVSLESRKTFGWGYGQGPGRIEFASESACWKYLGKAKERDHDLFGVECTHRDQSMWQYLNR